MYRFVLLGTATTNTPDSNLNSNSNANSNGNQSPNQPTNGGNNGSNNDDAFAATDLKSILIVAGVVAFVVIIVCIIMFWRVFKLRGNQTNVISGNVTTNSSNVNNNNNNVNSNNNSNNNNNNINVVIPHGNTEQVIHVNTINPTGRNPAEKRVEIVVKPQNGTMSMSSQPYALTGQSSMSYNQDDIKEEQEEPMAMKSTMLKPNISHRSLKGRNRADSNSMTHDHGPHTIKDGKDYKALKLADDDADVDLDADQEQEQEQEMDNEDQDEDEQKNKPDYVNQCYLNNNGVNTNNGINNNQGNRTVHVQPSSSTMTNNQSLQPEVKHDGEASLRRIPSKREISTRSTTSKRSRYHPNDIHKDQQYGSHRSLSKKSKPKKSKSHQSYKYGSIPANEDSASMSTSRPTPSDSVTNTNTNTNTRMNKKGTKGSVTPPPEHLTIKSTDSQQSGGTPAQGVFDVNTVLRPEKKADLYDVFTKSKVKFYRKCTELGLTDELIDIIMEEFSNRK